MEDFEIQELEKRKKWFKRYKRTLALIDRLEDKLRDLDERLYNVKSPKLSDMPRGGKPIEVSDLISDKEEIKNRINRLVKKARLQKREIIDKIDELEDPRHADVLEAFFIECRSFDEIANIKGYNTRHVIRLYSEALLQCHIEDTKIAQ